MFEGNAYFNQDISNWEFNTGCLSAGIAGMFAGCYIQREHKPWQLQKNHIFKRVSH
jgi:hypothetical protein